MWQPKEKLAVSIATLPAVPPWPVSGALTTTDKKEETEHEAQESATLTIQAWCRGWMVRKALEHFFRVQREALAHKRRKFLRVVVQKNVWGTKAPDVQVLFSEELSKDMGKAPGKEFRASGT